MNTLTADMLMEPAPDVSVWGSIAGGVAVFVAVVVRGWSRMRRDDKLNSTEVETLRALDAAVAHWRALYDAAWKQVVKERDLRDKAETRATAAFGEIEKLRSEVAALRREVAQLLAVRK